MKWKGNLEGRETMKEEEGWFERARRRIVDICVNMS
jgi:hypothetical protein